MWVYYRLHDDDGHVLGCLRTDASIPDTQYIDARGTRWHRDPIAYVDCFCLAEPPKGLAYLEGPEDA